MLKLSSDLAEKDNQAHKTYQSVEAHLSTACSPALMFCNISPSTSGDCIRLNTWLIMDDSLRIRPIIMHQSRQPASMKI